jgi:hypothetical protein
VIGCGVQAEHGLRLVQVSLLPRVLLRDGASFRSRALRALHVRTKFLDVRRELELLAGLQQRNDELIQTLMEVLSTSKHRISSVDLHDFDAIAKSE